MIRQVLSVSVAVLVAVIAQGCGQETAQVVDNDPTTPAPTVDAGPTKPPPYDAGTPVMTDCPTPQITSCNTQADCPQNSGGPEMYSCLPGSNGNVCTFEGQYSDACTPLQPMVEVNAQLDPSMTNGAQSLVLRVFYPQAVDGSTTSCASLLQDSNVDGDTNLNTMIVQSIGIPAQSGTVIEVPTPMSPVMGAVLYMEAWSGPIDINTQLPTGSVMGTGCIDNQTIESKLSPVQELAVMVGSN